MNLFEGCQVGQYLDDADTCQDCDPSCNGCVGGGVDYCLACRLDNTNFEPLGREGELEFGYCYCAEGFRYEGSTNTCDEFTCETDCDACPNPSLCALCSAGKELDDAAQERCICPDGTTRTNEGICGGTCPNRGDCHSDCCECEAGAGKSQYACTSCFDQNKELRPVASDPARFKCQCKDGFILGDDNQCHNCPIYGCTQCDASGACVGCKTELNFTQAAPVNNRCQCAAGFTWSDYEYSCQEDCAVGTFRVAAGDVTCDGVCDQRCETCEREGFCTSCKQGFNASTSGHEFQCNCPDGQWWDQNSCQDCDDKCAKCISANQCSSCRDIPDLAVRAANTIGPCECKEHFAWDGALLECVADTDCEIGKFGAPNCDQFCYERCETCTEAASDMCTTCPANSYRSTAAAATSECKADNWFGWSSTAQAFVDCPGFCRKCEDGVCDTCVEGAEKDDSGLCNCYPGYTPEENRRCKEPETGTDCPLGEYPFTSATGATYCEICGSHCDICASATVCQTCTPPYAIDASSTNGQCSCSATTTANYYEYQNQCIKCHNTCSNCSGPNASQCLKCIGLNHWFNTNQVDYRLDNGSCVCPDAFDTNDDGSCTLKEVQGCNDGEYSEGGQGENGGVNCLPCNGAGDALCSGCVYDPAIANAQCLECIPGASMSRQTGRCACDAGYYDASLNTCKGCQDSRCLVCDSDEPNFEKGIDCLECIDTLQPSPTKPNVCQCIDGFYSNSNSGACLQILNCPDEKFFSQNSGQCENCGKLCDSCHNSDDTQCITCMTNATLVTPDTVAANGSLCECNTGYIYINGRCDALRVCSDGEYTNANNECQACSGQCLTCTGSSSACTTCATGLTLQASTTAGSTANTGTCVCPSGLYLDSSRNFTCQLCDVSCKECTSEFNCVANQCNDAYIADTTSTTGCACNVAAGYYELSGACLPCHASCSTCSGGANYQCLTCKANSEPMNVYENNRNIGQGCKCVDGFYFSESQQLCLVRPDSSDCAAVSFVDEDTSTCTACDATCRDCLTAEVNQCIGCSYDRQFIRNSGNGKDQDVQVTGTCVCWKEGTVPGECDPYNCEDGYYRDSSDTTLPPTCRVCPAENNCTTCTGALATECVSCPSNMERADVTELTDNTIRGTSSCVCKRDFIDTDGTCKSSEPISQSCGNLPVQPCNESQTAGCVWLDDQLVNPSDACLQYMYPYCCENTGRCSGITSLNLTTECPNVNVTPTLCKFSNNTNRIIVKMSGRAKWNSFPEATSEATGTSIFSAVLKQETNSETNALEWVRYDFSTGMNCVVDQGTKQKIRCKFSESTQSTIVVGDKLVIRSGSYISESQYDNLPNAAQECTVEAPRYPPELNIDLGFVEKTEKKCQAKIDIDTSRTTGKGSCALTYEWNVTLSGSAASAITLSTTDSDTTRQLTATDKLTLTSDQYANYDKINGYVRITPPCWGTAKTQDFRITLSDVSNAPELTLNRASRSIKRTQKARFQIKTQASSCESATVTQFQYRFDILDSQKTDAERNSGYWSSFLAENFKQNKGILKIPRNTLEAGRDYNITVGASSDNQNWGEGQIYINVRQTPLEVVVEGGDRSANVNVDLTLTNAGTTNPDDETDTDFTCGWSCEDWTDINVNNPYYSGSIATEEWNELDDDTQDEYLAHQPGICTSQTGGAISLNSQDGIDVTIPAGSIPVNKFYYFKSTCAKNSVESYGYQWIRGIESTGEVYIVPKQLKPNWKNKLQARITSEDPNAYVQWSLDNDVDGFSFKGRTNRKKAVFDSSLLQSGTVYTFRAQLYEYGTITDVYATLDTMLKSPPFGGSFVVSPTSGTIDTEFTATFANWETSDGSEITYKINIIDESGREIAGQYSMLPELSMKFPASSTATTSSRLTVQAQVFNEDNGYSTTASQVVTITPPTTTEVETSLTTAKNDYDTNQNTQTLSERIDTIGRVVNYSGQTNDTDSQQWAEQKVADLPYSDMTTQDCEQVTSSIAQSSSYVDETAIANAFTNILATILSELTAETNSPNDNFFTNALNLFGLFSGRSLGSGRRMQDGSGDADDQMYNMMKIALYDWGVDAEPRNLSSDRTKASFATKSKQNMEMTVTSNTITSKPATNTNSTDTTISSTHNNPAGKVKIPSCHLRDDAEDAFDLVMFSGNQDSEYVEYSEQSAYEFDISVYQSDGTYEAGLASCEEQIELTLGLQLPDDINLGDLTSWNATEPNLPDGSWFECRYWDETLNEWSTNGVNQTATEVNFETNEVKCFADHMSVFTATVNREPPAEVIAVTPVDDSSSDDDDDDWDYLKNINAFYIGLGLTVVVCVIMIATMTSDKKPRAVRASGQIDSESILNIENRKIPVPDTDQSMVPSNSEFAAQAQAWIEIDTSMPFGSHPAPMMMPVKDVEIAHKDDTFMTTMPDVTPPAEVTVTEKVSLLEFMVSNSIIGEMVSARKAGFTRFARIIIAFTILQSIIALSASFMDAGLMWYSAGFVAAACGLLIEPVLTMALYTSRAEKLSMVKASIGFALAAIISVGSLIATWYFADDNGETFNNDWMLALTLGFGVWFLVGQQISSLYKYALYRNSEASF